MADLCCNRGDDPSILHLKKELTRIRKVARILRDPGTCSSWKTAPSTSRSRAFDQTPSESAVHLSQMEVINSVGDIPPLTLPDRSYFGDFLRNLRGRDRSASEISPIATSSIDNGDCKSSVLSTPDEDSSDALDSRGECHRLPVCITSSGMSLFKQKSARKKAAKRNHRIQRKKKSSDVRKLFLDVPSASLAVSPHALRRKESKKTQLPSSNITNKTRREGSCSTFSTKSFNPSENQETSGVGSWDGTTVSSVEEEDDLNDWLDMQKSEGGCGIPCYWSKKSNKYCCHPPLPYTLRRNGKRMFYGLQAVSSGSFSTRTAQGLVPFLEKRRETRDLAMVSGKCKDDDISMVLGELDLDRRSGSVGVQTEEEKEVDGEGTSDCCMSLSSKYRPKVFEEFVAQSMVVRSLRISIEKSIIAPAYIFHGPRGVGKSSAAKIFSDALKCRAEEGIKPCGVCRECTDLVSEKGRCVWEVDASNGRSVKIIKQVLRRLVMGVKSGNWDHMFFVVDECHLLPSKAWVEILKFLQYQLHGIVFIFITIDVDSVPKSVLSHCQKYVFNRIKDCDIVARLRRISEKENLDVEDEALNLIALNSDGSLHDAETLLEQLALLGKRITTSIVNELIGVVSSDRLLELLKLALSSNTSETVKRARQLLKSGIYPLALMSQMASLIIDHIASDTCISDPFRSHNLTETELGRLKRALKLLSDAEKQLRVSSERSAQFTSTLLQLGSVSSSDLTESGSGRRESSKTTEDDPSTTSKDSMAQNRSYYRNFMDHENISTPEGNIVSNTSEKKSMIAVDGPIILNGFADKNKFFSLLNSEELDYIWGKCILRCHSETLRKLLQSHGKLMSLTPVKGATVAIITFNNGSIKSRAEGFLSSITDSIENVLNCNVDVKIVHYNLPRNTTSEGPFESRKHSHDVDMKPMRSCLNDRHDFCYQDQGEWVGDPRLKPFDDETSSFSTQRTPEIPPLKRTDSIIREHRLEAAWLQAEEKVFVVPESKEDHLNEKRNYMSPQSGLLSHNRRKCMSNSMSLYSEDEHQNIAQVEEHSEPKVTSPNDVVGKTIDECPISPRKLHPNGFSNDNLAYESGSTRGLSCPWFFCCMSNSNHHHKGIKQVQQRRWCNRGRFLCFKDKEAYERRRKRDGSIKQL